MTGRASSTLRRLERRAWLLGAGLLTIAVLALHGTAQTVTWLAATVLMATPLALRVIRGWRAGWRAAGPQAEPSYDARRPGPLSRP